MKLIKLKCPNCGASLEVDDNRKEFVCEYCHTTSLLDDDTIKIEHRIVDEHAKEKLKIFKGFGIASLVYFAIIMVIVIVIIGVVIFNIVKISSTNEIFGTEKISDQLDIEVQMFNNSFELYSGTKSGFFVDTLLDKVITNNKTNKEHNVIIIYNGNSTSLPDEIVNIKYSLEDSHEYEISLDYDRDGFVNKIAITEI